jgi:hypothetical protein
VKILEADQATGVEKDEFAGIIGLSPISSEKQIKAFVQQVTDINRFSTSDQLKPQFSVYLSPVKEEDGSITFGGYDVARYAKKGSTDADIFWSSTYDGERYWTIPMIGAMYDKEFLIKPTGVAPLSDLDARYAILDTGVSYSLIPSRDYIKIQ